MVSLVLERDHLDVHEVAVEAPGAGGRVPRGGGHHLETEKKMSKKERNRLFEKYFWDMPFQGKNIFQNAELKAK